jgi:phasin
MDEITAAAPNPQVEPRLTSATPAFENAFASLTTGAPAAFRELAEKGLSQAMDRYEKMKSAAEEAGALLESSRNCAARGATDYGLKLIEAARTNANATFDYVAELVAAQSPSDVVELSTTHARKQFEAFASQAHDLAGLAQKVMTETAEPLKVGFTRVVKKVA